MAAPSGPDPTGAHVFLSYAAEDRDAARRLADALATRGHTVWWDRLISGGALWGEAIDRALDDAWAVIVLWSQASTHSDFVRAEARHAAERGVLVPARLDSCEPPMPFGEYQTIDLADWIAEGSGSAPAALLDALQFIRAGREVEHAVAVAPRDSLARSWTLLGYWTDLFQLATAPKTFLLAKWDEPNRVASAGRFYAFSTVLKLLVGLPFVLKIDGGAVWEIFSTIVYAPLRMLALGAVVHLAFRAVGGRALAVGTLTAFAYLHSLQMLLFECAQGVAVALLELLSPEVVDRIFAALAAGEESDTLVQIMEEYGLLPSAAFLALIYWPLFVVPFVGWGAFRVRHQVSRWRSAAAAVIAIVLGMLAYSASVLLSYTKASPR